MHAAHGSACIMHAHDISIARRSVAVCMHACHSTHTHAHLAAGVLSVHVRRWVALCVGDTRRSIEKAVRQNQWLMPNMLHSAWAQQCRQATIVTLQHAWGLDKLDLQSPHAANAHVHAITHTQMPTAPAPALVAACTWRRLFCRRVCAEGADTLAFFL